MSCTSLYTLPHNLIWYNWISSKTLRSPMEFKIKFCRFWSCWATQHNLLTYQRVSGFERLKISLIACIKSESEGFGSEKEGTYTWIRQSHHAVPQKPWSKWEPDREMEIKEGEPTSGQKSSTATAVEWQWEKKEYESYTNPSLLLSLSLFISLSLPPSCPPLPAYSGDAAGLHRSWLIHSQPSLKPTFVIQMKSCYLRDHCSSHYSALTYFTTLAAGAPFIKMLQSQSMCRERHRRAHTRISNPLFGCLL